MYIRTRTLLGLIALSLCMHPGSVLAAESNSYQLYGQPEETAGGPLTGTNYQMDIEMATWRALPGTSTNYQVVLAPPATTSSSVSSSAASSTPGTSDGGSGGTPGGGGGGRRSIPAIFDLPDDAHSSAKSSSSLSRLPVQPHPGAPVEQQQQSSLAVSTRFSSSSYAASRHSSAEQWRYVDASRHFAAGAVPCVSTVWIPWLLLIIAVLVVILSLLLLDADRASNEKLLRRLFPRAQIKKNRTKKTIRRKATATTIIVGLMLGLIGIPGLSVNAATTAPQSIVYNGHLLDSGGTPVTSAVSVRFSFWNSGDSVAGDVSGAGAINTAATTYAGWNEVHTVTPNSLGYFSLELGSVTSLPDFSSMSTETLLSLYLQVEVKESSAADTAYELLDFNTSSTTDDRSPMRSVPFALNADSIDKREVGTGSGNIAILKPGAIFDPAHIPGGTNSGTFIIDYDGSEGSTVSLQFGKTLGKSLVYDGSNARFNFNDDVRIEGDLTVTGLINGVNLNTVSGFAPLKVSSGAGLTVSINAGSYRLNGSVTNFEGDSNIALSNDTTNYVFFGSGGLSVSTVGFPTDESAIRLAQVVTSGGAITAVADRRVTSADDRERSIEQFFRPAYADAAYVGDGSSNVGQLSVLHDAASQRNHYAWTSTRSTLQDYDILLRVPLGSDFAGWTDNPLRIAYRSATANAADNKLDITVYDTAGAAVTLSGSALNLVSTSWVTTQIEFTGTPTFTPGEDFLVKFTVSSKDTNAMHVGETTLFYRELLQ